ncbi:MAG: hypothetical protein ACMXYE_05225 [Candidatus Woesearchaeota archaeon]
MKEKKVLLKDKLKKDSPIITENLKDICQREEEYAMFLYVIEKCVTYEYYYNKKLTDKEVIHYLNNFIKNIDQAIDFFETDFEVHLYLNLLEALNKKKITKHELKLCIRYILWSIDNRSWLNSKQAYVHWLAHATGTMSEKDAKQYETRIRTFCKRKGVPKEKVDAMLTNNCEGIELEDEGNSLLEARYFALDDKDKLDFVLKNFQDVPFLGEYYYGECMENKDFDNAEKLCQGLLEMMPESPPFENLLGIVYREKGNNILAKIQFERVLALLEKIPKGAFEGRDAMEKETKKMLKEVSK